MLLLTVVHSNLQVYPAKEVRHLASTAEELLRFIREVAKPRDVVTQGSVVGARVVVEFPEEQLLDTYSEVRGRSELKKYKKVAGLVQKVVPWTVRDLWGIVIEAEGEDVILNLPVHSLILFLCEVELKH